MQTRLTRWSGIFALWAFVGLVLSAEVYFNVRVTRPEVSFYEVAVAQCTRAIYWALLAPLILRLRVVVPLSRGHGIGGVSLHVVASGLIMAAFYLARIGFLVVSEDLPTASFWTVAKQSFFGRNLIDVVFYWAVIAFGYIADLQQRFRSEELKAAQLESRLMETELKALKAQLQPHFLFNTLNTISVFVREGRNDQAVVLIARLSSLLRLSLESTRQHEITVREEAEFLERYLDIQKARFADRLTVRLAFPPEVLGLRIPTLILQPIVENAILHGVAPLEHPGEVRVSADLVGATLRLVVEDEGCGFDPSAPGRRQGIGLSNTRERLEKIYGGRASLVLDSAPGRGTVVTLQIPARP